MARIRSVKVQQIKFSDIAKFTEGEADLDLIDIINDAVKEKTDQNFLSALGAFVYEIDLSVDVRKIMDLGVEGFKIEFYRKNPQVKLKPENIRRAKRSRRYRQRLRAYLRKKRPRPIFVTEVDLDIPLPPRNFQYTKKFIVPRPRTHKVVIDKPPQVTGRLFTAKISAAPLLSAAKLSKSAATSSSMFRSSLLKLNSDPAKMLGRPSPVYPTMAAKMSRASVPLIAVPRLDPSERISLNNIRIRRSLEEDREGIKNLLDDDSDDAQKMESVVSDNRDLSLMRRHVLGYVARVQNRFQRIRRQIEIPKYRLGVRKDLFVKITPIIQKSKGWSRVNRTTKSYNFTISHKQKLTDILRPEFPPEMTLVKNQRGAVVLRLKQVDPGATKVAVIKRVITKRKRKMTPAKLVKMLKVEAESAVSIVIDLDGDNVFPNRVIYRAVPVSPLGATGPLTSLVITGVPKVIAPAPDDPNELSIVAKNEEDQIRIEVERIPEDVVSIRLIREDIDETGEFFSRTKVIAGPSDKTLIDVAGEVENVTFYDKDTALRHRYRYFAAMREPIGSEFLSEEDEVITRLRPTNPLPVEVSLENAQLTEDESGNFTVSIDAISLPQAQGVDFMLSMLEKAGVAKIFLQEMQQQRALFADLSVFIVERIDRVTGKRESFGQHSSGQFTDDPVTRKRLKLSPLQADSRYSYFFKLCLRPPQSLMKSIFTKFSTSKTPGVDNQQVLAQKFMSAFAGAIGAMPSSKELVEGIPVAENFRMGETGIVLEVDIRTPKARPTPTKLKLRKINKGRHKHTVILRWELEGGDIGRVDHCLIFVEYAGRKICIGSTPCDGSQGRFWYLDKHYGPQIGRKRYTVKCVYDDLKMSAESKGVKSYRKSFTPPNLLTGRFLGIVPGVRR